jgi:alpha-amylase/alpha-mannosidase (GH57 family)
MVWYHLGWMAETVRREDSRVLLLQDQAFDFSIEDRRELLEIIGEQLASIGPRYRKLAESGQIELAMSPYAHPILPLLVDLNSAREAMPEVSLPKAERYPGGEQRSRWHLTEGIKTFKHFFGRRPDGCWASEGALSDATLALLNESDFTWTATGDSVLHNSLKHSANADSSESLKTTGTCLHRAFHFSKTPINCFFRDDGLSDLIGFKYATWHADDAVGDLLNHMEAIASTCETCDDSVISIIMDGENAWEYFPENAYYFLDALYARLSDHPALELTTYSKIIAQSKITPIALPHLVAGSWVYGSFSTWIGDKDKNRGWDMLCEAKCVFDQLRADGKFTAADIESLEKQLALCEGSDWFWWFGDYNPAQSVSDFEYLFRRHLINLYTLMGVTAPESLSHTISVGGGAPATGGVMRQGHAEEVAH